MEELDFEVKSNWKVIVDNAIEGYHFNLSGPVHKELTALIQFDKHELNSRGKWWYAMGPAKPGMTEAFGKTIGDANYQTD